MAKLTATLAITDNMTSVLKAITTQADRLNNSIKALGSSTDNYSNSLNSSKVSALKKEQDKLNESAKQGSSLFAKLGSSIQNAVAMVGSMRIVNSVMNTATSSISSAIGRMDTMETFTRKMTMITGSSDDANSALDQLRQITKGTAYGLDVAAAGVQNFVTRGMSTQDAVNSINVWSNAVAAFGQGTNAELETVMDALGKMRTKGTIEMEQMSRLFDIGINPIEDYAKATGRTAAEVQADLTAKKISTEQFLSVVEKAYQEGTNGVINVMNQGKAAGTTWTATMDNMRAACTRGMVSIITEVDDAFKALNSNGLKGLIAGYGKAFENMANSASKGIKGVLVPALTYSFNFFKELGEKWDKNINLSEIFTEKIKIVSSVFTQSFPAIKNALDSVKDAIGDRILPLVQNLVVHNAELFEKAGQALATLLPPLIELGRNILIPIVENGIKFLDWVTQLAATVIPPIFDNVANYLSYLNENILPSVTGLFSALFDTFLNLGSLIIPPVFTFLSENLDVILPTMLGIVGAVKAYKTAVQAVITIQGIWNSLLAIKNGLDTAYLAYALWKNGMMLTEIATTQLATGAQIGFNMALLACPITWIVAGIAAVIGIIALLWTKCEWFRNGLTALFNGFNAICDPIENVLQSFLFEFIPFAFGKVIETLSNVWQFISEISQKIFTPIINAITYLGQVLGGFFVEMWDKLVSTVQQNITNLQENWTIICRIFEWAKDKILEACIPIVEYFSENIFNPIVETLTWLRDQLNEKWSYIVEQFGVAKDSIINVWNGFVEWFDATFIKPFIYTFNYLHQQLLIAWESICNLFNSAYDTLTPIISLIANVIYQYLIEPVINNFNLIKETIINAWNAIVSGCQWAWTQISELFSNLSEIFTNAVAFLSQKFSDISNFFSEARDRLLNTKDDVGQIFIDLWNNVTSTLGEIVSGIKDFGSQAVETVKNFFSEFYEAGKNLITGLWSGITDSVSGAIDKVKEVGGNILSTFKNIFNINSPSKETHTMGAYLMEGLNRGFDSKMTQTLNIVQSRMLQILKVMKSVIVQIISNTDKQLVQLYQKIKQRMDILPPYCKTIGTNMMKDLSKGISSNKSEVLTTAGSLVEQLKQTFIEGLGIHSPSHVMQWIGEMMIAGLLKGLSPEQILSFIDNIVGLMETSFSNGTFNPNELVTYLGDDTLKLIAKISDVDMSDLTTSSSWPYPVVGKPFHENAPFHEWRGTRYHQGIDLMASHGDSIVSVMPGVVTYSGGAGGTGYGDHVEVDHGNGFSTVYAHFVSGSEKVRVGDTVTAGQVLGLADSTGNSTGDHLHFELWDTNTGTEVDPTSFLQGATFTGSAGNPLVNAIQNAYNLMKGIGTTGSYNEQGYFFTNVAGADVAQTAIQQALSMLGLSQSLVPGLMWAAYNESSYNPNAINNWDSNARMGDPSRGLFQTIGATFEQYKYPGYNNIYGALDNTLAAIRYMISRYGSVENVVNPRLGGWYGYATGTMNATPGLHWVGENGPELMAFRGGEIVIPNKESEQIAGMVDTFYTPTSNSDDYGLFSSENNNGNQVNYTFDIKIDSNPQIYNNEQLQMTAEEYENMFHKMVQDAINGTPSGHYSF